MRILLINPPPYHIVEQFDRPTYPRTALAVLAGYLRHKGIDVHVLDCKYDRLNFAQAIKMVEDIKPDIVGFTAMTNEIKPAAQLAGQVKNAFPKITTIIGGVHLQAMPEGCLREFPEFDFGIVGEGQESLCEFICNYSDYKSLGEIKGVCFIDKHGKFIYSGNRQINHDLDSIYLSAWDLFRPAKKYIIQTSLGCPFKCPFCMNPNGPKVRFRSPKKVLEEIETVIQLGSLETFHFGDEAFTIKRKHTEAICRGIIEKGFAKKASWYCVTHVGTLDREIIRLMKEANCYRVAIGVETADMEMQKCIGKGLTYESLMNAAKTLHSEKMPFEALCILGHPNETRESAMNTINFAVKLNPSVPIFGIMVPYPGTVIGEMAKQGKGGYKNLSSDWNDYNKHLGNAVEFENLTRQEMERIMMLGYVKVFVWNKRFYDLLKFIWTYRGPAVGAVRLWISRVVKNFGIYKQNTKASLDSSN